LVHYDTVSIPEPVQDYSEHGLTKFIYRDYKIVSIPEPVQDYSELPLFEPVAAQGVEIAKIRTYFKNHKNPPFCKYL